MQLSETVKVYPTEYQKTLITQTMTEYINTVNSLISDAVRGHSIAKITTADVKAAKLEMDKVLICQVHCLTSVSVTPNLL